PNPFNPQTSIRFTLPQEHQVTLNIYNIQGQLVKRLVDHRYDAGAHTVNWDGQDQYGQKVASGIYIYRIQAGAFSQTRKMILIK
ncbi:T9SS type A sorting domain-containing protein, partial [Candidatus Saccharibacteria bacterium]|nr:T9SS type A sorting domain-containing protein [Candidatus Saccharibacteria bacterium]NIV03079.1 T9SS type A sorting domain-containing protein [Calditrichia bacterium]NIW77934.1 T9SS type A sorting domain-containing protein [Calditrichia bacterium]